jgi:hypothetical protein
MKSCDNSKCAKPFEPAVDWQRYCSKVCGNRVRVRKAKVKRTNAEKNSVDNVKP